MAGFNISNFRSQGLVFGGARPTNFLVTLQFPDAIDVPGASEKAQFLVRATSLPESIIGSIPIPYFGRTIKLAGNRDFEDWNVTILNDEDFLLRNTFEAWHNGINTIISNRLDIDMANIAPALGNSYKTRAFVTQFAKTGPGQVDGPGATKTYLFEGIFPTLISDIPLDYNNVNEVENFSVRFAYDWWEPYVAAGDDPIFPLELPDDF